MELVCDQVNAGIDDPRDIGLVHLGPMFERLAGPDGLTRNRSMFGRREIIQGICDLLPNGAPIASIVEWADLFVASEHCVQLTGTGAAAIEPERVESFRRGPTRPVSAPPTCWLPNGDSSTVLSVALVMGSAPRIIVTSIQRSPVGRR